MGGEFTSSDPYWQYDFHVGDDGSQRATVNAGWTQLHLFKRTRPHGFFVPAQTAGYFFSIGGIVANSVHGGAYNEGFINEYVTRMRVMDWQGVIHIIDQEEELRHWRCSFGLLGIILGVEFRLEHRTRLEMYSVERRLHDWNEKEFWRFIMHDAEADIPMSSLPSHIQNLHGNHGSKPVMFSYSQKKSENASDVPENGIPA